MCDCPAIGARWAIWSMAFLASVASAPAGLGASPTMSSVAVPAVRPAGVAEYADVCFRYMGVRPKEFPTVEDAKKAMRDFHATRVDWFYAARDAVTPDAIQVPKEAKAFIDWCHARGMKVGGAIHTLTTEKAWAIGPHNNMGRFTGDPGNSEFVKTAVAWGTAQIDAGVDTMVCDDVFGYRSAELQKRFSDNVIAAIKAHKPGFTIAGNNGSFIRTDYVKNYAFDFHYSDNNFVPTPGLWWAEAKAHRALNSAILLHPNRPISKEAHRAMIALSYANGAHVITPWDEYIHGKGQKRLFADPADYADLYGFVRALGELGYLNDYEDAAVGGFDLKENRYGHAAPISVEGGSGKLSAFARAKPGEAAAPVVIHLVESSEAKPSTLRLSQSALFGASPVVCKLYTPPAYDRAVHEAAEAAGTFEQLCRVATLESTVKDGKLALELPGLSPWGLLVISPRAEE